MSLRAVISDFGGVLTTPLIGAFANYQDKTGISGEQLGLAMQSAAAELDGTSPLYELECGRITEVRFLELLQTHLEPEFGHRPEMRGFKEIYFEALEPNEPMIELMWALKRRGLRMGLLTNNVREWEPLWRPMLPVDEIFEFVVDSGFVGMRKPDPAIYELAIEQLDGIGAGECLFVDDVGVNCDAARELGMTPVQFHDNEQAIAEVESALAMDAAEPPR